MEAINKLIDKLENWQLFVIVMTLIIFYYDKFRELLKRIKEKSEQKYFGGDNENK